MSSWTGCLDLPPTFKIPEHDEGVLRTIMRIAPEDDGGPPMPRSVMSVYRKMKRAMDTQGAAMDGAALATIIILASYLEEGGIEEAPEPKPVFTDVIKLYGLKPGITVKAMYRNREREGIFHGITNDGKVLVDIEGEERNINPVNVWIDSDDPPRQE